jgi:hypothetical protein
LLTAGVRQRAACVRGGARRRPSAVVQREDSAGRIGSSFWSSSGYDADLSDAFEIRDDAVAVRAGVLAPAAATAPRKPQNCNPLLRSGGPIPPCGLAAASRVIPEPIHAVRN